MKVKVKNQFKIQNFLVIIIIFYLLFSISCQQKARGKIIAKVNNETITDAEFTKALPAGFVSDSTENSYRHSLLEQLITKKLFIQEAKKLGLDKEIENVFERDKQTILIQALYDDVVTKNAKVSSKELSEAKKLMATEVHLKLISVPDENIIQLINNEIKKGTGFDTLAKLYSQDPSGQNGGDIGFVPILYFEEPVRKAILKMKQGEVSQPVQGRQDFKIINYLEKRPSSETAQKINDDTRVVLEQEKSQKLAMDYLNKMQSRIVYNPEGLKLFYKSADQITPEESEIWVVKKDNKKIVKAKNLLHVAREFPVTLDTAMRTYAIKRAVEDDVLYEDALARKLDKKGDIIAELEKRKNDLLYEKFYLDEITQKININEKDIADYYNTHKDQYVQSKLPEVTTIIRNAILSDRRVALFQTIADSLKTKAKIEINEKLLITAGKTQKNNKKGVK